MTQKLLILAAALALLGGRASAAPAPGDFLPAGAATHLRNAEVKPIWLPGGGLAYRRETPQGQQWVIADTATGKTGPAFDAALVADGLSKVAGTAVKPGALPFETFAFAPGGSAIDVAVGLAVYRCSIAGTAGCIARPVAMVGTAPGVFSPDRRWIAYLKDGKLRVHAADGSSDTA